MLAGLGAPPADAFTAIRDHWDELVGPEAAPVLVPVAVSDGQLTVSTTSPAWASQARWLEAGVVARAAELVGEGVVRTLVVRVRNPAENHRSQPKNW